MNILFGDKPWLYNDEGDIYTMDDDDYYIVGKSKLPNDDYLKYWNVTRGEGVMLPLDKQRAEQLKQLLQEYLDET